MNTGRLNSTMASWKHSSVCLSVSYIPGARGFSFDQVNRKEVAVGDFSADSSPPTSHTLRHRSAVYKVKSAKKKQKRRTGECFQEVTVELRQT